MTKINSLEALGIPDTIVAVLLPIAIIVAVAPWVSQAVDFGVLKIPPIPKRRFLRIFASLPLIMIIVAMVPLWPTIGLVVADAGFRNELTDNKIDVKLINEAEEPVFVTSAKITVRQIYAIVPYINYCGKVVSSGEYDILLPVAIFPYEITVKIAQHVPPKDVDRFILTVQGDSSFFDELIDQFLTIRAENWKRTGVITYETELAARDEYVQSLDKPAKRLLQQVGLGPFDFFCSLDIIFDFDLAFIYNGSNEIRVGRFLFGTGASTHYGVSKLYPEGSQVQTTLTTLAREMARTELKANRTAESLIRRLSR